MKDLTIEQIIEINKKLEAPGKVMSRGNLELIVDLVENAKSVVDKASELLYEIIVLHPFVDGNKRTGFIAMDTFLKLNGKVIKSEITDEYIEKLVYEVAIGEIDKQALRSKIKQMIE